MNYSCCKASGYYHTYHQVTAVWDMVFNKFSLTTVLCLAQIYSSGKTGGEASICECLGGCNPRNPHISTPLVQRKTIAAVFIDFSKAFDSMSHTRLLTKLQNIGITNKGLSWFQDFLTNRTSTVRYQAGPRFNRVFLKALYLALSYSPYTPMTCNPLSPLLLSTCMLMTLPCTPQTLTPL